MRSTHADVEVEQALSLHWASHDDAGSPELGVDIDPEASRLPTGVPRKTLRSL